MPDRLNMPITDGQYDNVGVLNLAGTASPTRPSSSWTNNSVFTDSAISMRTRSPAPLEKESDPFESNDASEVAIADRLNGLVSEIWACEQDGPIRGEKRRKIARAVEEIEAALEDEFLSGEGSDAETTYPAPSRTPEAAATSQVTESDLDSIRTGLAATVHSMRMRQQEQGHLHQLTVEKLEAVAQRCIEQEQRLREFAQEISILRETNRVLVQENEDLNIQLSDARSECTKKEIAVNAMSSAVSGLEGYVNGSPTPNRPVDSRRVVTRGKGRFRGRYYVDEPAKPPHGYGPDGASDAKALHEGVTAWLRGFRDVEEELRSRPGAARSAQKRTLSTIRGNIEEDWGEFETATNS